MKQVFKVLKALGSKPFAQRSPREQFHIGIYWSVVIIAVLILGFTSYHIQRIPANITESIYTSVDKRPWVKDLVRVDGRDIYLAGEVEPDMGLGREIGLISNLPGVRSVSNNLTETPKPQGHFYLSKSQNKVTARGKVTGETLESLSAILQNRFTQLEIDDGIKIDDRLGHPLWLEGFAQSLQKLAGLNRFELNGWRDQLEITGEAESDLLRRQIGYALPVSLIDDVKVVNHLKQIEKPSYPSLSIGSDWRGVYIHGQLPSEEIKSALLEATVNAFGVENPDSNISVNASLVAEDQLLKLVDFLPQLGRVRGMKLESTDQGFVVWGRVDDAIKLGNILSTRNDLGLGDIVYNQIEVVGADRSASVTLFSDGYQAILNGKLPSAKSKKTIIELIEDHLAVRSIIDLISIEPNIEHSEWLGKWSELLSIIPSDVIGITIDDASLLLTGNTGSEQNVRELDDQLNNLFPDSNNLNWLTTSSF